MFALPLGHWLTNQDVTRKQVLGALIVVAGLAMFVDIGDPGEGVDNAATWEIGIATAVIVGVSVVLLISGNRGTPAHKAAFFGIVAGLLFGLSATFDKPAFSSADDLGDLLTEWELYALVGFGVMAFVVQQLSLATGQFAPAMAAVAVANPFASSLIGIIIYDERLTDPGWHKLLAVAALIAAFVGTVIITLGNREKQMPEA